jgi:formiminoglutamate deiminase
VRSGAAELASPGGDSGQPTTYHADFAWLGGDGVSSDVLIEVESGRIASVRAEAQPPPGAVHLRGVTLPGLANAHSHAFQRALRGRAHRAGGSFWTWREDMYAVAERLAPDSYFALARATYAEMALAGVTCVGEFHYLHDGGNAFGEALIAAAAEAGLRITLLDACYLAGGFGQELRDTQRRFGDGDAERWAERVSGLRAAPHARIGAAIHSVRAVPADQLGSVVAWAAERDAPLHFHLSEQRAENEACLAAHGCTPAQLLADHGALGPRSCAVHATHLTDGDRALLSGAATTICMCPTTERDLADGIGSAGAPLALGSDSHAVIDLFEEARATERRGHFRAAELLRAATAGGHAALGWPEAGRLEAGAVADLVTVGLDSVRLAGAEPATLPESLVFAASSADVRDVIVGGRQVVAGGRHALIDDVPAALAEAIARR